ncbi:hypothetical protein [Bacteroides sp. GM023]|uniref:hypothetical protein n=1 Tax=Bacteroides sp. GM023 TaxID=2723058 RepID=UPI00168BFC1E|nr:hypothetical protein [Bacteroides sp. GM023]MBD3592723.1 hypothetical protein [Bacteroides sp. GM023]
MSAESRLLSLIQNNPFRVLGVYANASTKEIVANIGRTKAFLKVNRDVVFSSDFSQILPFIRRNVEMVTNAESQLTLPHEKIKYALYWFVKVTPLDDIAFNHLNAGEITSAIAIWDKKECFSSLLNKATAALIQENLPLAINSMMKLLQTDDYRKEFMCTVVDTTYRASEESLVYLYLDCLIYEMKSYGLFILQNITGSVYREYVKEKLTFPIVSALEAEIEKVRLVPHKDSHARYNAGVALVNATKTLLEQLKSLCLSTDMQYQIIADKLGIEILQCGIDYFNNSEELDAALKAIKIQKYAFSIVVGKMAKDRCIENVGILQKIIDDLPPKDVYIEDKQIKDELAKFCRLPAKITYAMDLLRKTHPLLQAVKKKLGASNGYYLKISTQIVSSALYYVIEEVNNAQKSTIDNSSAGYPFMSSEESKFQEIKSALYSAWKATQLMDTFDMEKEFKNNRYVVNRNTLRDLCRQVGVSTSADPMVRPVSATMSRLPTMPPISSSSTTSSSSSEDTSWGCIIAIGVGIIIFILSLVNS